MMRHVSQITFLDETHVIARVCVCVQGARFEITKIRYDPDTGTRVRETQRASRS